MHCGLIAEALIDIQAVVESPMSPVELADLDGQIGKIEVWHSSFEDDGPDFDEYRVFDADGNLLDTFKTNGY